MEAPKPFIFPAKFLSNHDGDTVNLDIDMGFNTWRLKEPVRIEGIDTPEISPAKVDAAGKKRPQESITREKERALVARDFLTRELLGATKIMLESHSLDKYGRSLGDILYRKGDQWLSVSEQMIANGYAVAYGAGSADGLTKTKDWGAP